MDEHELEWVRIMEAKLCIVEADIKLLRVTMNAFLQRYVAEASE